MALLDPGAGFLAVNGPAAALFGATGERALIGRDFLDFVNPEDRGEWRRVASRLLSGGAGTLETRLRCRRYDGSVFSVDVLARRVSRLSGDGLLCVLGEVVTAEAGLPATSPDARDPHDSFMEAIEALPDGFALYDADGRLVLFNESYRNTIWPRLKDFIRAGIRYEDLINESFRRKVWDVASHDREIFIREALARHNNVPSVHEIHYPDGRIIRQSKRPTIAGGVIGLYTDVTEQRRRDADISETQDRHRRLLETLPDGVVIHSGGKFAYVNPALIEIYGGRSHTDLIGRNSADFIPPEDREEALKLLERVMRERVTPPPVEQRRIRLDGQVIYVEVRHTFIQWNGKPAILTVIRDLTERKRTEHVLRETEQRYLSISSNLPGAVYQRVMYPDGTISFPYISRGVIETHGIDAETVKRHGSVLVNAIHPDERERFSRALQESARTLMPFDIEVRNVKPDGQVVWVRSLARPRKREDGAIVWDGLFVDVTARKVAEERAAQTYRWLKEAIESLSDGFVLWDAEDRIVLWNDRFLAGHPQRAEIVRVGTSFERLIEVGGQNLAARLTPVEISEWRKDRMRHHREASGSYEMMTVLGRWLLVTERRTHEGYTVGIYTDITNRKRRADELRQSEERYRRLVQLSPDAIFVHIDGQITFANETAATMMAAASSGDLVGRDILDFAHPDERLKILSQSNRIGDGTPPAMLETRYVRLDGEVRSCETAITQIRWQNQDAFLVVIRDIEERVEAERQQAIISAVLAQAGDSVEVCGADCSLLYVNPAFERMTGFTPEEAIGRKPADVLDPEGMGGDIYAEIHDTVGSGQSWKGLVPARRKNGTTFQQEATISPVFDEHGEIKNFIAIKRDITDRLRTETALRESEDRYRKLLALTPDAIYVHVDTVVVYANAAAVSAFRAREEADLVGRSIFDIIHPDYRNVAEENMRKVVIEGIDTLRMDQRRRRLDGTEFWANTSITPLTWQGQRAALVIVRDITEQRKSREELVRAMEAAEVANRSKSEFLANMSHELRTPLNAIIGFSEIMQNEMFGPLGSQNYSEYARDIHESGMHLLHVINDILDLSKVEAGKLALQVANVNLEDVVQTCVRFIANLARDAEVGIETRIGGDLPIVRADPRMVKQMLMNLLSNAIKFSPEGARIRISAARRDGDLVELAVTDTGIGISEEDLPRVLEPFVQVDVPMERRQEGTGLGLPLTKSLAELHGGSFRIWSRERMGTRAVILLPISPPAAG
jgi:PAS domain S-box-containing protein